MTTIEKTDRPDATDVAEFTQRFITDLAATQHAVTVLVGDRLGLYRALARTGAATAAEVAAEAGCDERYVLEWLRAQAASGYCEYTAETDSFHLTPAQRACLAEEDSPTFLTAGVLVPAALFKNEARLAHTIRSGTGLEWWAQHNDLFVGVERFFRPGYAAHLTSTWIPALSGVEAKLIAGARVADVGCGHGASTILLAEAYPNSTFLGIDSHAASIEAARAAAERAGVADRVRFEVASAQDFPADGYALVCVLDALHDMGDPVAAARRIRQSLDDDGTWMLVEPAAGESLTDNLHTIGRLFYSASTLICTPAARSQAGGWALGAQATEGQLRSVAAQGGFTRFRRAVDTPVNRVIEIRP